MSKQNIYDNEIFFEGYKTLREKANSANNLFEKPALFALLPDLHDKCVLDLGCGYGENCLKYAEMGAGKVIGLDISEKMLEIAKTENSNPKIEYKNMPMEDISLENLLPAGGKFDLVVSSLAIHYVEDYAGLVKKIYALLKDGGYFIFSQESPINTCFTTGNRWTVDENGNKLYANLSNYSVDGKRESKWFVEGIEKYHRTFSTVINTLIDNNFKLEKLVEPYPTDEMVKANSGKYDQHLDLRHKPDFLLVKAVKV